MTTTISKTSGRFLREEMTNVETLTVIKEVNGVWKMKLESGNLKKTGPQINNASSPRGKSGRHTLVYVLAILHPIMLVATLFRTKRLDL